MIIAHKNSKGGINLTILTHQKDIIVNSATLELTNVSPSGDNPEIIALTKNLVIVQSKTGSYTPSGRSQIHPVYITDNNVMTARNPVIVSNQSDSGNYGGLIRFSDTTFGALYRNVSGDSVGICLYTTDSTGTSVVEDRFYATEVDGAWDTTCLWTGEDVDNVYYVIFSYSKSGSNLIAKSFKYVKSTKITATVTGQVTIDTSNNSGQNQRPYLFTRKNGTKGIAVFHRGANQTLSLSTMDVGSTGAISNFKSKIIVNVSGAGYITTSGEERLHSALDMGEGLFYLVFRSTAGNDTAYNKDLSGAFIDFNQANPTLISERVIHSQSRWRFPLLMHFGGNKYGLNVMGNTVNSFSHEVIQPSLIDLVKVAKGNDIVKGIAMTDGENFESIKIVIPNA